MGHLRRVMDKMGATRKFSAIAFCLAAVFGLAAMNGAARGQQQEKRIALVVGNGAYAKSPLATAANDAGLIAQTLQAAGFDVVGARDLDGDTLRRSLRDFLQKAEQSGPDTVAMIYVAGYGLQLAGENYFIPVDSPLAREGDIPIEGVRVNDYLRRLSSLQLKASIVVLDAARQQPFIEGGQPIAGGLALVEPDPRMLIAFNAAPSTVAPAEPGPYGAYAQALAEMIRTGGLPLPELFDRLRLRVNEATKGAQVPWHAQKLDTDFVFFDRAPDAPPPQAPPDQVASARSKPIRDLGPQDAYAAVLERDTLQGYDEFVAAYPGDPMAKRVRALAAARREAVTWMRTYRTDTPEAYWSYLRRYPNGPHAADARRRLAILTAPPEPPPAFAAIEYDVPPPPPEEVVYVDRPVVVFSDPYYDFAPPPPPPVYFLPPPPPDFVILAPPPPPVGLFILPQPVFVAMPLYVRPPVYVRPPPNNIIFANIHNTTVINNVINRPPQPVAGPGQGAPGGAGAQFGGKGAIPVTAPGAASPALPPSVAQRATLIQQGKAPVPPSAAINPAIKPGGPTGTAAPSVQPANAPAFSPQGQPLPRANALPVPGAKGAPPPPPSAATGAQGAVNPNARLVTPPGPQQGTAPSSTVPPHAPPGAGVARLPSANAPPSVGGPKPPGGPAGPPPRVGSTVATTPPAGAAGVPPRPAVTSVPKPPPSAPQAARTPSPPPPQFSRPTPPPQPRIAAPSPPPPQPRIAAPSPPRPQPRMAAPSPPPPRVSAPPPVARMAAPAPPPPRFAAPPPPRPAAPPPAAARRCPPNVPRC